MKKQAVVEIAKRLFSEKGYYETSMDEIARVSGVSKGTIYKYFPSKEELLIEILNESLEYINEQFSKIYMDEKLNPKEKIIELIYIEFNHIMGSRKFALNMFVNQLSNKEDIEVYKVFKEKNIQLLKFRMEVLILVYGEEINDFICDSIYMFDGILKEYVELIVNYDFQVDVRHLAQYVAFILDSIIQGLLKEKPKPIITLEMFKIAELCQTTSSLKQKTNTVKQILSEIENKINGLPKETQQKYGYLETFNELKNEIIYNKEINNQMLKVLIYYLKGEESITVLCCKLEDLLVN